MDLPLVDTHVHFWDPPRLPCAWLAEVPSIAARHAPSDLRAEAGARLARQMVFVEAGCDRAADEVAWIEELAAQPPTVDAGAAIGGIVAFVPMDRGADTTAGIAALAARPLARGARHLIQNERDPRFCARPAFVAGVRQLGERGLSFDACIRHHQLPALIELARACPGTTLILDHAGKPDIRGGRLDPWRAHIAELATVPNVVCKLSGLVTEADPAAWTIDGLRPYVQHLLETFGPGRLLFGSDWPVVKLAGGYGRWLEAALALTEALPAADRRAIFVDNARRIYRLTAAATAAGATA